MDGDKGTLESSIKDAVAAQGGTILKELRDAIAAHPVPSSIPFPEVLGLSLSLGLAGAPATTAAGIVLPFAGLFSPSSSASCAALPPPSPLQMLQIVGGECVLNSLFASLYNLKKLSSPVFNYTYQGTPLFLQVSSVAPPAIQLAAAPGASKLFANISVAVQNSSHVLQDNIAVGVALPFTLHATPNGVGLNFSSILITHIIITNSSGTFDESKFDLFVGALLTSKALPALNAATSKGIAFPASLKGIQVSTGSGFFSFSASIARLLKTNSLMNKIKVI